MSSPLAYFPRNAQAFLLMKMEFVIGAIGSRRRS